jgi:hypothetical protein
MKFKGKFETLCEDTLYRFQQAGFLTGDVVKFKENALDTDFGKKIGENFKERIKHAQETGLNLRVSSIKTIRANTASGTIGGAEAPDDFFVDVVVEYAPGLWREPMSVPVELIERIDCEPNLAPVPDSMKRETREDGDLEKAEWVHGDQPEQRELTDKNVVPQHGANSYTINYMQPGMDKPKEV